jgi:CDGSH-type Zn-finger protein
MKEGSIVMITEGDHEGKAATVVSTNDVESVVKIFKTEENITIEDTKLKRRKACVCGLAQSYPFCDGSHANG